MKYDVKDIKFAKGGALRIEWANQNMPVLNRIRKTAFGTVLKSKNR
jgi:S-adenosylhomocysteine hydrolase